MKRLTPKQERFCIEYHKSGNGYQSYLIAYPKASNWKRESVDEQVKRMLKNPLIVLRLDDLGAKQESRALITVDEIMSELRKIAFDDKSRTADKIKAFELMGKHLRMWVEQYENVTKTSPFAEAVKELAEAIKGKYEELKAKPEAGSISTESPRRPLLQSGMGSGQIG